MAINAINFLKEIGAPNGPQLDVCKQGLSYSKVGDCLEWDDWNALDKAATLDDLRSIATSLIPKYEKMWEDLGKPPTAETWYAAMYAPDRHTKKAYANMYR